MLKSSLNAPLLAVLATWTAFSTVYPVHTARREHGGHREMVEEERGDTSLSKEVDSWAGVGSERTYPLVSPYYSNYQGNGGAASGITGSSGSTAGSRTRYLPASAHSHPPNQFYYQPQQVGIARSENMLQNIYFRTD